MPRYLRVADIPAVLSELQDLGRNSQPYQKNEWQQKWCKITDAIETDVAVLSYRWRIRGSNETFFDFRNWLSDCRSEGYAVHDLRDGPEPVEWSLADGHDIQIEVAVWLLWLYTNRTAEYVWVDQMCVPQDADLEEKMSHIKESPAIYTAGKVFLLIAPVVDYLSGRIMNAKEAHAIVKQYTDEMNDYRGARFLSRSAVKALLVNNSYMRRVWTIQEAVAARDLTVWPLMGRGEVNSYQSIYVVDWPEFNAWNSHPALPPIYLKFQDEALNDYYEGDYTGIIRLLREHPVPDGIGYMAMISKDLLWITMDRNGLVNDLKRADTAARRAFVVLNNHQVQSARSFLPEDRVLALVPLVDYSAWREATRGVPGRHLVQASVAWAYGILEQQLATWKWSIRIYNSPTCRARGLDLLQPRRNLGDSTSMFGATPGWELKIPPQGGSLVLTPPPPHPDPTVVAFTSTAAAAEGPSPASLELRVEAALLMPHPGQAKYWGGGPWTHIRDALGTDEVFRLSVQWGLEPWRNPELELEVERSGVVVVTGGGLKHPAMIILGLKEGEQQPTTAQVMEVVEISNNLLPALLEGLRAQALGTLTVTLTAVSAGVVPPPPPPPSEPSTLGAPWQLVLPPGGAEASACAPAVDTVAVEAEEGPAPAVGVEAGEAGEAAEEGQGQVGGESQGAIAVMAGGSRMSSRPASARPGSARPGSARPESAKRDPAPVEAAIPQPSPVEAAMAPSRPASAAASAAGRLASAVKEAPSEAPAERLPSARPASAAATAAAPASCGEIDGAAAAADVEAEAETPMGPPAGAAIHKGEVVAALPHSGVEVAAGAKYAGQAPVVQGAEGPCKGCIVS